MQLIKNWIEKQKLKNLEQKANDLYNEFDVVERDGSLWLTHMGVAFKKLDKEKTAQDVAIELIEARRTAITFRNAPSTKVCL